METCISVNSFPFPIYPDIKVLFLLKILGKLPGFIEPKIFLIYEIVTDKIKKMNHLLLTRDEFSLHIWAKNERLICSHDQPFV